MEFARLCDCVAVGQICEVARICREVVVSPHAGWQGFDFVVRPVGVEVVATLFVASVVINCGVGISAPDDVCGFG